MQTCVAVLRTEERKPLRIFFTGDWHIGNCNFDREAAVRMVDIIMESARKYQTYVVTMGDLFDLITHADAKRFVASTIDDTYQIRDLSDLPTRQMDDAQAIFGPIMPLVIARLVGNHESAYKKYHSIDIHQTFFRRFAQADGFVRPAGVTYAKGDGDLGYIGFLKLQISTKGTTRTAVTFCLNHGDGGGGYREGYPKNKMHDVFRWSDADYSIMGHIHQLETDYREHHTISDNNDYTMVGRWKGISGTLLRTSMEGKTNYFEHKGRAGGAVGCLMAEIRLYRQEIDSKRRLIRDLRLQEIRLDMPEWKYWKKGA